MLTVYVEAVSRLLVLAEYDDSQIYVNHSHQSDVAFVTFATGRILYIRASSNVAKRKFSFVVTARGQTSSRYKFRLVDELFTAEQSYQSSVKQIRLYANNCCCAIFFLRMFVS